MAERAGSLRTVELSDGSHTVGIPEAAASSTSSAKPPPTSKGGPLMAVQTTGELVLEPADAASQPPFLYELGLEEARKVLDDPAKSAARLLVAGHT
jgi:hypothetical protein